MPDCASNANPRKRRHPLDDGSSKERLLKLSTVILIVVAADQISKFWAVGHLTEGCIRPFIGQFLQLKLIYNRGGALGTDLGSGLFYMIISMIILAVVIYFLIIYRNDSIICYSLAVIAGGAAGNIVDRLRLGKVIDFIDVDFFDINFLGVNIKRWWTFNIADAAITMAEITLVVYIIFMSRKGKPRKPVLNNIENESPNNPVCL
jgi:signal peptidase II